LGPGANTRQQQDPATSGLLHNFVGSSCERSSGDALDLIIVGARPD
jgi:hypothetical protein